MRAPSKKSVKECLTTTGIFPEPDVETSQPLIDHSAGATDSGINNNRLDRTVEGTGAAFHAAVQINDIRRAGLQLEDGMRTNRQAKPATDARLAIQPQRGDIWQIRKTLHTATIPISRSVTAKLNRAAITGKARLISQRTPEGDVYGVLPVKFIP